MYPANGYIDPYFSQQRDRIPYPYPLQHVGFDAVRPPMKTEPPTQPSTFGPWPYHGNIGYSNPTELHSCCNPNYPPAYYWFRPPFPHEPPPPHLYYHAPFPAYPGAHPPYHVPPYFPVDQTPYHLSTAKSHCCGCPNHVCHGRDSGNVKIEEQKPESEQVKNSTLVGYPNYPFPLMWVSPSNTEDKMSNKSEAQPQAWNGWIPLDINGKRLWDGKSQAQSEQKGTPFQWPIVWMPGHDKPQDSVKQLKETDNPKVSEEVPSSPKIKIIPLSFFENGNQDEKPTAKDQTGISNEKPAAKTISGGHDRPEAATTKEGNVKTIPVVQNKENEEKPPNIKEQKEEKKASIPQKADESHSKELSSKQTKLPPVCLRVDPLPKKKSAKGSSRSPSPPSCKDKEKSQKEKEVVRQNDGAKEANCKKEIKVIEVKDSAGGEAQKRVQSSCPQTVPVEVAAGTQAKEFNQSMGDQKLSTDVVGAEVQENEGVKVAENNKESQKKADEVKTGEGRMKKINLSETDAAVRIQSSYRGYNVRRWQPLEKLKRVKEVEEQVQNLRKQVQSLEASSKVLEVKERLALGETIMNLLLKLDTIQGLHPSVREARKSVARELVCLQEKLDCLGKTATEQEPSDADEVKPHENKQATMVTASQPSDVIIEQEKFASQGEEQNFSLGDPSEAKDDTAPTEQKLNLEGLSTWVSSVLEDSSKQLGAASLHHELPSGQGELAAVGEAEEKAVDSMELKHDRNSTEHEEIPSSAVPAAALQDADVPSRSVDVEESQEAPNKSSNSSLEEQSEATEASHVELLSSSKDEDYKCATELGRASELSVEHTSKQEELSDASESSVKVPMSKAALDSEMMGEKQAGCEESPVLHSETSKEVAAPKHRLNASAAESQMEIPAREEEPQLVALAEESSTQVNKQVLAETDSSTNAEIGSIEPSSEGNGAARQENVEMQFSLEGKEGKESKTSAGVNTAVRFELNDSPKESVTAGVHATGLDFNGTKEAVGEVNDNVNAAGQIPETTEMTEFPEQPEVATTGACAEVATGLKESSLVSSTTINSSRNEEKQLLKENEQLREMLQKLLQAGKDQVGAITELNDKVKDLERKLAAQKRRVKVKKMHKPVRHLSAKVH